MKPLRVLKRGHKEVDNDIFTHPTEYLILEVLVVVVVTTMYRICIDTFGNKLYGCGGYYQCR